MTIEKTPEGYVLEDLKSHNGTFVGGEKVFHHQLKETDEFYRFMNLEGHAQKIKCPTLVLHGGLDRAMPVSGARQFADAVSGPVTRLIWDDSGHCNHDRSHYARPAIADFLANNL